MTQLTFFNPYKIIILRYFYCYNLLQTALLHIFCILSAGFGEVIMYQEILTFGECLEAWMKQSGHNITSLSTLTNQRSNTTISRLIHDQCSVQRCKVFIDELIAAVPSLTDEDIAKFTRSLDVNRFGKERYLSHQYFSHLLKAGSEAPVPPKSEDLPPLAKGIMNRHGAKPKEILCFGCMEDNFLSALVTLLLCNESLTITHYFVEDQHSGIAALLPKLLPILYNFRYELISVRRTSALQPSCVAMQDALLVRYDDGNGEMIVPGENGIMHTWLFDPTNDLFAFYQRLLNRADDSQKRYGRTYRSSSPTSYPAFLSHCLGYEQNRAIWHIKPDIGIEYLPVHIVNANFQEMIRTSHPEFADAAPGIIDGFMARYRNLYSKRQTTYLILCREAMLSFARTGQLSDHPFCLRPFTPQERIEIFEHFINQSISNPYFHLLLLSDPKAQFAHNFICYDKLGLLLCDARTNYDLTCGYKEIMISAPNIVDQFRDFVVNVVIKTQTDPESSCIDFFRHLIRVAKSCEKN